VPGPNSGWSEAATAGGIQRRLIGPIWLGGKLVTETWLGAPEDPEAGSAEDYRRASRLVLLTGALFLGLTFGGMLSFGLK
jgi:adenosylcobinamide-phosphate synthase